MRIIFLIFFALAVVAQSPSRPIPLTAPQLQRVQAAQEQIERATIELRAAQERQARAQAEMRALLAELAIESKVNPETHEQRVSQINDKEFGFAVKAKPKEEAKK